MAGMEGVEPPLTEPESAVLPLDDIPVAVLAASTACKQIYYGTAPPSARGEFRRILYLTSSGPFEPFRRASVAFVVKNESVVTVPLGKRGCASPTAQIDGPVIPATGEPHRPFRRMSVTTLSILTTKSGCVSYPVLITANWIVTCACVARAARFCAVGTLPTICFLFCFPINRDLLSKYWLC